MRGRMNCRPGSLQCSAARSSKAVGVTIERCQSHLRSTPRVAKDTLPDYTLPNGLQVKHTSTPAEVQFLYQEHFCERVYLRNKVSVPPGSVVVDVGANIGLFAMTAAQAAGSSGLVICVEPEPKAAAALTHNIQQHARWCAAQGQSVAPCLVLPAAVGDGSHQQARLTVYQGASGWSTLVPDEKELINNMKVYLGHLVAGSGKHQTDRCSGVSSTSATTAAVTAMLAAAGGVQQANAGIASPTDVDKRGWSALQQHLVSATRWLVSVGVSRSVSNWIARQYVTKVMMGQPGEVTVDVITVSDIIRQHDLKRVDLLKVDVERAELAVLQGVEQQHWPLIQQVAMEVHDIDNQLQHVLHILEKQGGFSMIVKEQDPYLSGSTLYNLYAIKF